MEKGRLEAFSDGVLAVAITIMVLELKPPADAGWEALHALGPALAVYVLSFIYIGIYWNNHHHMLQATRRVNGGILWANLHLLFWLSLVPVVTAWMGRNPHASAPAVAYGAVLFMAAVAYYILERLIVAAQPAHSPLVSAVRGGGKEILSVVLYGAAIVAAFFLPVVAQGLYVLVALIWLVPDRRIERRLNQAGGED